MTSVQEGGVRGFLHKPETPSGRGLVLTHGAGGNAKGPMLAALAETFCAAGFWVLRCDLPFRQRRPFGPPSPANATADRAGLREAVAFLRNYAAGPIILSGHSYGGRQATMLAAEEVAAADALLLFSYPLHAPGKPDQLRTAHFPSIRIPAVFVHGTKDPFGSLDEMRAALPLIPAKTKLIVIEGAGHDLLKGKYDLAQLVHAFD